MGRDRANIRTDIWADGDWRKLRDVDQHLYLLLLTHATLNYAGVADWRPGRIAALSEGGTVEGIRAQAAALQHGGYILVDETTEEVLVRSFIKHDGLMKQPKLAVAMANAFAGIASAPIREVIAHEVQKLRSRMPELSAWESVKVQTVLNAKGSPIATFTHAFTPPVTPNLDQAQGVPTTTATTTATSTDVDIGTSKRKPERPLPDEWGPSSSHQEYARTSGIDLAHEVGQFRAHAVANDRRQRDWDAAFRTWLGNAKKWAKPAGMAKADVNAAEFQRLYGGNDERAGSVPALDPGVG